MTLLLYKFTCSSGHVFEAPESSGEYGEFVARGVISSEPGVLQAVIDPVYDEVDSLLRNIGAYDGKTPNQQADLLQSVFGVACDPAPDGTGVALGRRAPCPTCGTRKMASWEPSAPYSGPSFRVTHRHWQRQAVEQKNELISRAASMVAR